MYTLHGELLISFISTSNIFNTFSQLNTQWEAVAIFNQAIWVCELSIMAMSILTHNIRRTDFFQFLKRSLGELRTTNDWNFQCFSFICSMDTLETMLSYILLFFPMLRSKTWEYAHAMETSQVALAQKPLFSQTYHYLKYC